MLSFELTADDKAWLHRKYPDLRFASENDVSIVAGVFNFEAIYSGHRIADSYEVRIELEASALSDLPRVRETGSRIKQVAKSRKIDLADLHTYDDGTACLCVKPDEAQYFPDKFHFQKFIEELVVPFFYANSYFERHGNWPWETYSHGSLGWLEWYFDQGAISSTGTKEFIEKLKSQHDWKGIRRDLTRRGGVKSHRACLCGSAKSYWSCHPKAFRGLRKLARDMKVLELDLLF